MSKIASILHYYNIKLTFVYLKQRNKNNTICFLTKFITERKYQNVVQKSKHLSIGKNGTDVVQFDFL